MAWFNKSVPAVYEFASTSPGCTIRFGYYYPDESGILTYINLEHPWFAKYFMVAAMLWLGGDRPPYWRVPSIVLSAASLVLTYLAALMLTKNARYASLASALLLMDATFRDEGILAMLDAYVGFFTVLSVYLYLRNKPLSSAVAGGAWDSQQVSRRVSRARHDVRGALRAGGQAGGDLPGLGPPPLRTAADPNNIPGGRHS